MATLRTVTVKSSGGDYSSLSSAESGEQGDLVSLDRQLDIECYAFDDTAACNFSGWTTDATRYIRVFCPSGEGHSGVWTTSKYRRRSSAGFGVGLTITEEYVRVEGIQCYQPSGSYSYLLRVGSISTTSDVRIERCILNGNGATLSGGGFGQDGGICYFRNNIVHTSSGSAAGGVFNGGSNTLHCDNNTLIGATYGAYTPGGIFNITNSYCHGGTDAFSGSFTSVATCAHSSATSFSGSTASIAYSTANFLNVTSGSEDLHLDAGASSTLLTGGTDLSGTFTVDIDGETRSDWSIGADEIVAAPSGGQPTWKRFGGVAFAARGSEGVW